MYSPTEGTEAWRRTLADAEIERMTGVEIRDESLDQLNDADWLAEVQRREAAGPAAPTPAVPAAKPTEPAPASREEIAAELDAAVGQAATRAVLAKHGLLGRGNYDAQGNQVVGQAPVKEPVQMSAEDRDKYLSGAKNKIDYEERLDELGLLSGPVDYASGGPAARKRQMLRGSGR